MYQNRLFIFGRIQPAIYLCSHYVDPIRIHKALKETVPQRERLTSVLCDQIYSRPFRSGKGFFNITYLNNNHKTNQK